MKKQNLVKFVILILLLSFSTITYSKRLFIDYADNINSKRLVTIDIQNSKIKSVNWSENNQPFYLALKGNDDYIIDVIANHRIQDFIKIKDPAAIELLEDITKIFLSPTKPTQNMHYCELKFSNEIEIVYNGEIETAISAFDYNDSDINIVDIQLKQLLEIVNYTDFNNLYNKLYLREAFPNNNSPQEHPFRDGFFWLNELDVANDYTLVSDICKLDLNSERIKKNKKITIPIREIRLNIEDTTALASLSIIAADMEEDDQINLVNWDEIDNDLLKIPDMSYKNLYCIYKFKNSEPKKTPITADQVLLEIEKRSNLVKIPQEYADINFIIRYWDEEKNKFKEYPYIAHDNTISLYNKLKDNRAIFYINNETHKKLKITINDKVKPPELVIHKRSPIFICDLNHTHRARNEKNKTEFISFLNEILASATNKNVLLYKFFTLAPYNKYVYAAHAIENIRIREDAMLVLDDYANSSISKDEVISFIEYIKEKNVDLKGNETIENFYVLEPFTRDEISSIKVTDTKEDINDSFYRDNVKEICQNYFAGKGYKFSEIIYITYYPLEFEDDNSIKYYSFKNDRQYILNMIK